jgi:glycosyltransferase involved in cell wall biosynthesis
VSANRAQRQIWMLILGGLGKLEGYRRRLVYEWQQWQSRRDEEKAVRCFDKWLESLTREPPDVLLGANFAAYGGVRHHIRAIQQNSSLKIELAPPGSLIESVGLHRFTGSFRERFFQLNASPMKALHSHVFPWFIDWCAHQKAVNKVRWVHTHHNWYYPEFGIAGLEPWQLDFNDAFLRASRDADVSLTVCRHQQKFLHEKFGLQTHYLPNGVDVDLCDRANAGQFQRKIGLHRFILYVGRNDPVKNPGEFVELARRLPGETFVMIGGGLDVLTVTESYGSPPANLRILGGMPQSDVQDAIAACSVLVVTSKREGLPTLVLEAMVHETPLIVPDETGCMEAVNHGAYADIYELTNIDDLRSKTIAALERGRTNLGARQRILQEYDWKVIAPSLDAIYLSTERTGATV